MRISQQRNDVHRGTFVGTSYWVSPEMLNESVSGPFVDLWALGVIIFEMITGDRPFKGAHDFAIFE